MNAITAILDTSARLGLPRRFESDLEHDADAICADDAPDVFGWVVYDCGTHLVDPHHTDGAGQHMLDVFREVFRTMFRTDRHCFVWTGTELREMPNADAMIDWLESHRQ